MIFSKSPCKIIGLRVGEVAINLINPDQAQVAVKFLLMREDGTHAGLYSKSDSWGDEATQAFEDFMTAMEKDVLNEVFEESTEEAPQDGGGKMSLPTQDVPTLGDGGIKKTIPQI